MRRPARARPGRHPDELLPVMRAPAVSETRFRAGGLMGHAVTAALFATVRFRAEGEESFLRFRRSGQPVIFVLWHRHLLPLVHRHRGTGVVALVSEHSDGEYITRVMRHKGLEAARGSSTRGGSRGLRGLIRAARSGRDLAVTADGPRGPAGVFKPGALLAAQMTGLPLIPVAAGATSAWTLASWDRFLVPRPLSVVRVEYGEARWVPRDADREGRERIAAELASELDRLSARCAPGPARRHRETAPV
jgi:lysophospholipid acyltransferase (LPLAT)-like uncharacterized protein